jgi:hypothetical protein
MVASYSQNTKKLQAGQGNTTGEQIDLGLHDEIIKVMVEDGFQKEVILALKEKGPPLIKSELKNWEK